MASGEESRCPLLENPAGHQGQRDTVAFSPFWVHQDLNPGGLVQQPESSGLLSRPSLPDVKAERGSQGFLPGRGDAEEGAVAEAATWRAALVEGCLK